MLLRGRGGKSLVIDAVETLLEGNVADEVIRHGSDKALIEGIFALPDTESLLQLKEFLADYPGAKRHSRRSR